MTENSTKKKKAFRIAVVSAAVILVVCAAALIFYKIKNSAKNNDPVINFAKPDKQVLTKEGNSPQIQIPTYNETATDALNRMLPTYDDVGAPKENKYVGVFYFLWTSDIHTTYDNTKFIARSPLKPKHAPYGQFHWWDEPETGYHRADDVWQIKRDLYYLSAAGVDFVYMDFTNGYIYEDAFRAFLDTSLELRASGIMTPYVVPWAIGTDSPDQEDMGDLKRIFYSEEKYSDLWFYWEGKPLALVKPELDVISDTEFTDRFTFRVAWTPDVTYPGQPVNRWRWADNDIVNYGYSYGWDEDPEKAEFAGIGAAGFANIECGRSGSLSGWDNLDTFRETEHTGEGLAFLEAFEQVMKNNPETEVITISRWNEWMAQYYDAGTFGFIDQYNREFSRDFEPAKNKYTDNNYYLMCSVIRRFKGVSKSDAVSASQSISIEGDFSAWQNVTPVFNDFPGDTSHRNYPGVDASKNYINETGRNDIIQSRFTYDTSYVYFYAKTAQPLTPYTDKNWMLLFIDADNDKSTGWEGYDYVVNYCIIDENRTVICKYQNNLWQEVATAEYRADGSELHICIPRSVLGLTGKNITLGFHWMDNVTNIYSLYDWFTTGDSAPERRNNYFVKATCAYSSKGENVLPARDENRLTYMKAGDVDETTLNKGLEEWIYNIGEGYDRQPEINLLGRAKDHFPTDQISADLPEYKDMYALSFTGWIYVAKDGMYTFNLRSDDGAALYIDERLITDNTGVHTVKEASGEIGLCAGYHAFSLEYFECGNGDSQLSLDIQGGEYAFYYQ